MSKNKNKSTLKELLDKEKAAEKVLKDCRMQIDKFRRENEIKVSDHAIVRYLERIKGVDINAIKEEIVTDNIRKMVDTLGGAGIYPDRNHKVVMKNYTVVTVETLKENN